MKLLVGSLAAALLLVGCGNAGGTRDESSSAPPAPTTVVTSTRVSPAPIKQGPDLIGRLNPAVTQATLKQTVCRRGWTRSIRPPASYTNALKRKQVAMIGRHDNPAAYEEDHLMPLELGGAPRDPVNLWPILWDRARLDDVWENRLHRELCAGEVTLAEAQARITAVKRQP